MPSHRPPIFAKRTHPGNPEHLLGPFPLPLLPPTFTKQSQSSSIRHFAKQTQVRSAPSPTGIRPFPTTPFCKTNPSVVSTSRRHILRWYSNGGFSPICKSNPLPKPVPGKCVTSFCKTNPSPVGALADRKASIPTNHIFANQSQHPELELGAPRFCRTNPPWEPLGESSGPPPFLPYPLFAKQSQPPKPVSGKLYVILQNEPTPPSFCKSNPPLTPPPTPSLGIWHFCKSNPPPKTSSSLPINPHFSPAILDIPVKINIMPDSSPLSVGFWRLELLNFFV